MPTKKELEEYIAKLEAEKASVDAGAVSSIKQKVMGLGINPIVKMEIADDLDDLLVDTDEEE